MMRLQHSGCSIQHNSKLHPFVQAHLLDISPHLPDFQDITDSFYLKFSLPLIYQPPVRPG